MSKNLECKIFKGTADKVERTVTTWLDGVGEGAIVNSSMCALKNDIVLTLFFRKGGNDSKNRVPAESAKRNEDGIPICPQCGATMRAKENRSNGNKFWGCPNFFPPPGTQKCSFAEPFSIGDERIAARAEIKADAKQMQSDEINPDDDDIPF